MEQIKLENIAAAGYRFLAFVIDGMICLILSFSAALICSSIFSAQANAFIAFDYTITAIIQGLAVCAYFVLLTYFTNGATLGKLCVGIRVVCKNEEKLSFLTVLYRETIGRFLNTFLFIGYILLLFDAHRRSAADFLSDTLVVNNMYVTQMQLQKMNNERQQAAEQPIATAKPLNTAYEPWQLPDGFTGKMQ